MKKFVDYCKDCIIEALNDYDNSTVYGYELVDTMPEDYIEAIDSSYTESDALQYIHYWWNDCIAFYEFSYSYLGSVYAKELNVFENPTYFMTKMVTDGISILLSNVSIISENWDEEFTLDEEVINTIIDEVSKMNKIEWVI